MSWQAYIDTSLLGSGNVDCAAIFSVDGKDNWARSPNFKIKPEEMQVIVDSFKDHSRVLAEGIRINGEKYTVINNTETSLWGKKGKEGIVIAKTKQALLLGHHPDTVTTNAAVNTVEALGDYLVGVGY